jgi:hypothetical protein
MTLWLYIQNICTIDFQKFPRFNETIMVESDKFKYIASVIMRPSLININFDITSFIINQ